MYLMTHPTLDTGTTIQNEQKQKKSGKKNIEADSLIIIHID